MTAEKNQFGVPQYPNGDARQLFVLLAAIDLLERPTVSAVADLTGRDRDAIDAGLSILREQFDVDIHRVGDVYRINSWGQLLQKQAIQRFLHDEPN